MIRLGAVRSMLLEEIADIRPGEAAEGGIAALRKARSRATLVVAVDWLAILTLFALQARGQPFLVLGGSEQGLFSLGVLAVATHAGFRLGQRQKLDAVLRALETLPRATLGEE